jgi:hypothetical protein
LKAGVSGFLVKLQILGGTNVAVLTSFRLIPWQSRKPSSGETDDHEERNIAK